MQNSRGYNFSVDNLQACHETLFVHLQIVLGQILQEKHLTKISTNEKKR